MNGCRRFNSKIAVVISVFLILTIVTASFCENCFAAEKKQAAKPKQTVAIAEPEVSAGSCIVMSGSTSEKVFEKHSTRKLPMGSITKLMTAMVVIDNMYDDNEYESQIVIDKNTASYGSEFAKGESVSVEDLLKAMLVGGSNEAAEALARYSASKRDIFISEMNSKAMEIDLMNTQFTNPTGIYDNDHYSTAEECAVIAQSAIRYEKIKEILALDSVTVKITGKSGVRGTTYTNTNPLLSSTKPTERYQDIKGGILSSLDVPDKFCQYAGIATVKDMQLIVVILEGKEETVAADAIDLFNYGDNKVTRNTIIKKDKEVGKAKIRGGAKTHVKAYTETKGFAYIPPEGSTDLVQTMVVMDEDLSAPLKAGSKVGEYRIYVADELKGTVDLVIKEDVGKGWFPSKIYISNLATALITILLILVLAFVIRVRSVKRRKARLRARRRQQEIERLARQQAALDEDRQRRKWTYSKYYDSKDINDALKNRK